MVQLGSLERVGVCLVPGDRGFRLESVLVSQPLRLALHEEWRHTLIFMLVLLFH